MKAHANGTVILIATTLLLSACNLPGAIAPTGLNASDVATRVAATMQALATPTVPPTPLASPTAPVSTPLPTPLPTLTPTKTTVPSPTGTSAMPGAIAGGVYGYPYGDLPALTFVAFNQASHAWFWWADAAGQSYFETDNFITPGKYQVVAYDPSGHAGACPGIVTVTSNTTANCDVNTWGGSYPAKPAGVP